MKLMMDLSKIVQCSIYVICALSAYTLAAPAYQCGSASHFTAPSGVIKSHTGFDLGHNYGKDVRCIWTIVAPAGMHVELIPDTFDVEQTSSCSDDYLELFDGNGTSPSTSLGKFCGTTMGTITTGSNVLTLLFKSDSSTQKLGFKLNYNFTSSIVFACASTLFQCTSGKCVQQSYRCDGDDDCMDDSDEHNCPAYTCSGGKWPCQKDKKCINHSWLCDGDNDCSDGSDEKCKNGHIIATANSNCGTLNFTSSSGDIMTPGYPSGSYPDSLVCKWQIFAPNGSSSIQFTFQGTFNVENDVNCAYDFLKIHSDGNTFVHGPYCGTSAPASFTIPAKHAIVEFTSDNSDSYTGFKLHFQTH